MAFSTTQSNQPQAPTYRKLHRAFWAACILLAPLALSLWFGLCPTGANDASCPDQGRSLAVFADFRAMNPLLMQVFLFLNLLIPYLYPLSCIGLGILAMKRSPWFATFGMACGFIGSIVWGLIAGQIALLDDMAQIGTNSVFVIIEHHYYTNWMTLTFAIGWLFGHLLAYVLLGIALARARVVPRWAAWVLVVSAPVMGPIAYGTGLGLLQIMGFVLVFLASVPAALTMLKGRDQPAVLPLREPLASTR